MPYEKDQNLSPQDGSEEKESKGNTEGTKPGPEETGPKKDKTEEKYSFLQETIKPKPISREKLLKQLIRIAVYGVVLGGFACIGFFALKPWAQNWFQGNPKAVTIPEDDEGPEEGDMQDEETETVQEPVFDAQSFDEMMDSMYSTAKEAQKGVVTVNAASGGEDWDSEATGITKSVTGVITADNGQELLILADNALCSKAGGWTVTFSDGTTRTASLKRQDANSGLAMYSVARNEISDSTWNSVKVSSLGNSNLARKGDSVIAFGNMFGYAGGAGYGIISSCDYKETFYDGGCDVLSTDIAASPHTSGVLFNLEGEVIGMISSSIWEDKESSTANAYAISDIKTIIELLANGESVPYAGVYGTTVTAAIQEEQGIPAGVYVIDVDPDSPAMAAGIQSGDVIWKVAGETVTSTDTYQKALLGTQTGDQINLKGKRRGAEEYVDVDFTITVGSKE